MASTNSEASLLASKSEHGEVSLRDKIPKLELWRRRPPPANSIPVPVTPDLPATPDLINIIYATPSRRIISEEDLNRFLSSPTYSLLLSFVFRLTESVADTPNSSVKDTGLTAATLTILDILRGTEEIIQTTPPEDSGGSRFGNKAFIRFLSLVEEKSAEWHRQLGVKTPEAISEVSTYLMHSFGDATRIDYGSGHELNFIIWLLCLYQLGIVSEADFTVLVIKIFGRYLQVMRRIQLTYYLEPAGSHGVWGLDDYQFLPFLFGASQLLHHRFITPRAIHQELTLEEFGDDYLYLDQVRFVNSTKTVKSLRWHSPMLDDISSAKSWIKVEAGMRRMFVAEVLGKLPVMQHFLFGSLVAFDTAEVQEEHILLVEKQNGRDDAVAAATEGKHVHGEVGWGDCCGIKVPSSIAATQEMRKKQGGDVLRRIPFD